MSISNLYHKFNELYGPSSSAYSNLPSDDDAALIDLCVGYLSLGYHPVDILSEQQIDKINKITSVNFRNLKTPDSKKQESLNSVKGEHSLIPSDVVCKHYSRNSNLSSTYAYANEVDLPTCSSDKINDMICYAEHMQTICPFFSPDHSLFANYNIKEEDKEYSYKVFKHRSSSGNYCYSIHDSEDNLLNKLSYPIEVVNVAPEGLIEEEILNLVNIVHTNAYLNNNPEATASYESIETSLVSKKSYLATLVS